MLELSACIEWLFDEEPVFAERVGRAAAAAGFAYVEFWSWRDKDLAALAAALEEHEIGLKSFVSEPEGRLVDRATHPAFLDGVQESARVARSLGAECLIVLSGDTMVGVDAGEQREAVVGALREAAPIAAEQGVTLVLEPLNTRIDHAGYFLDSTREGLDLVEAVASDNVKLLLDVYHSVVMGEDTPQVVGERIELVGHVHLADVPGRQEPGSGTIDWPAIVSWLRASGYRGAVGLEYMPSGGGTLDSLALIAAEIA